MDVYKPEAFEDRVNYAAAVISRGTPVYNARHFYTCFEMNDGDIVAAALVRRTIKKPNTRLAVNLFRFIDQQQAMQNHEATKHIPRHQLAREAARRREEAEKAFAVQESEHRAKQGNN